jgi:hypothetical protein
LETGGTENGDGRNGEGKKRNRRWEAGENGDRRKENENEYKKLFSV